MVLHRGWRTDRWNRIEILEINLHIYDQKILTRVPRPFSEEKMAFRINDAGKAGYPHTEEWSWMLILPHIHNQLKIDQAWRVTR